MGNEMMIQEIEQNNSSKKNGSLLHRLLSSKIKKKRGETSLADSFFVNYVKNNKENEIIDDITSFDQRRQVFVSLIGLFQTWQNMPSHVLYSSLFILPLKKKWIYNLIKYRDELIAHDVISQFNMFQQNIFETKQFIQMLKWKDSQGLVFWMLDSYDLHPDNKQIDSFAPFWKHLSSKLTNLYDPVTQNKYNPIKLNKIWWENQFGKNNNLPPKFENNVSSILRELFFLSSMKFKAIQEIIIQSNPSSLNPIISYNNNNNINITVDVVQYDEGTETNNYHHVDQDNNMEDELGEEWWISPDYDPYDLDGQNMNY